MADGLTDLYRRLTACCPAWQVRVLTGDRAATGPEWVPAAAFADRRDELIAGEAARIKAQHGCAVPDHVAGSRLLHHYLWSACLLASGPWYLAGLVPELPADGIWLAPGSGELAVRPADGAARPGGPERLRAVVAEHAEAVLAAFRPVLKRGDRALWGMVTDDLASGIWYLGRMLGEEERAVAWAARLLPGGTAPLVGSADFRRLSGSGAPTRTRVGCCLYYAVRPGEACLTCPRTGDAERERRLAAV
jgi:hypothetical protein